MLIQGVRDFITIRQLAEFIFRDDSLELQLVLHWTINKESLQTEPQAFFVIE